MIDRKISAWRYVVFCVMVDVAYWLINGLIDFCFFANYRGRTLLDAMLFDLQDYQIFRRLSSLIIAVVAGSVIAKLVRKQKKAEDDLRKEKDFSKLILDSISEELSVIDVEDLTIISANKHFLNVFGPSIGSNCHLITHAMDVPCTSPGHDCPIAEMVRTGKPAIAEHIHLGNNGEKRYIEVSTFPIFDDTGKIFQAVHIGRDITERKRAEEELDRFVREQDFILRNSPVGITLVVNREIVWTNQKMEDIFQYSAGELVGKSTRILYPSQEAFEEIRKRAISVLSQGGEFRTTQKLMRKDGSLIWIRFAGKTVDSENIEKGIIWILEDITVQKQIKESQTKIQRLESLGILAGGIAHDFNNLLAGIMGNVEMCLEDFEEELLEEALKAAKRGTGLTRQLLSFAKGGVPDIRTIEIVPILREVAEFSLKGSSVRCEFDLADDLYLIDADAHQISQVIQNLLINANQAMLDGGIVTIQAKNVNMGEREGGEFIQISIKDEGIGIPIEIREKIFDPYFSTKKKEGNSGLGLAVSFSIINKHGGQINVESEEGIGTTFHIFLPASTKGRMEVKAKNQSAYNNKLRVLIMDDDEAIRNMLRRMLEREGNYVVGVKCGEEAIDAYKTAFNSPNPFDVVIMDLIVPGGMNGSEALKYLRKINPQVRAVASSGYSDIMPKDFDKRLVKPYSVDDLRNVLNAVSI